jgi:O-antigen/teichoic acid export membrane protein
MTVSKPKTFVSKLKATGFMHIFGAGVLNQIVAFLSGIILVRIISKSDYGVFSYTNNILSFFMLASGFGAISGILQVCSENYNNINVSNSVYRFGVRFSLSFNLLLSSIIFGFALISDFLSKVQINYYYC